MIYIYIYIRVVQKHIAKIFFILEGLDPPNLFPNPKEVKSCTEQIGIVENYPTKNFMISTNGFDAPHTPAVLQKLPLNQKM